MASAQATSRPRIRERGRWRLCVPKNLDSTMLVMKTAENRAGFDRAVGLNRPMDRCILVQSAMCPQPIIVGGILAKNSPQMSLSKHDQVVDAFPSDRAD
jgi:hypothetical protein